MHVHILRKTQSLLQADEVNPVAAPLVHILVHPEVQVGPCRQEPQLVTDISPRLHHSHSRRPQTAGAAAADPTHCIHAACITTTCDPSFVSGPAPLSVSSCAPHLAAKATCVLSLRVSDRRPLCLDAGHLSAAAGPADGVAPLIVCRSTAGREPVRLFNVLT